VFSIGDNIKKKKCRTGYYAIESGEKRGKDTPVTNAKKLYIFFSEPVKTGITGQRARIFAYWKGPKPHGFRSDRVRSSFRPKPQERRGGRQGKRKTPRGNRGAPGLGNLPP